jgi:hypothetical protein
MGINNGSTSELPQQKSQEISNQSRVWQVGEVIIHDTFGLEK